MKKVSITWGNETLTIESGVMARQADGAVLVMYGGSAVLTTVVSDKKPKEGLDFLPLTVDYREKTYAAGKIPGGFFKRESRPGDKETLTSRLIDRPIRPLFPKGYNFETQVISLVLSADHKNDPDLLGMIGAGFALAVSDVPIKALITSVRVGRIDGELVLNPTYEQLDNSELDMIVAGTKDAVVMVECFADEVEEAVVLDAIEFAHKNMAPIFELQEQMVAAVGKPKREFVEPVDDEALLAEVTEFVTPLFDQLYTAPSKLDRQAVVREIKAKVSEKFMDEENPERESTARSYVEKIMKQHVRQKVLSEQLRLDRRNTTTIRPIDCKVGVLPMTHGSALFTRGETQALATVTLGTSADHQRIDDLEGESAKSFMLHYNFPPFSVGEVRFLRAPGRREIGHGMLAERALQPLIPPKTEFPYTIRIVSEILESNGSSSMATVCGSTLALMDAGVPLKRAAAGIAMGLIKEEDNCLVLSDILGTEDALGDMDLKVAGTREGITAIQMDMKIAGITRDLLEQALTQSHQGRMHILDIMKRTMERPRAELSPNAPRIVQMKIKQDKIRDVIGPGGKVIRGIIEQTGATINIEDDGTIEIASVNQEMGKKAEEMILKLIEEAQVGKIYLGKVKRVEPYGAFIGILPGVDGLLHISQIADYRVQNIESELNEGDDVLVKLIEIDKFGRLKLSRKAALRENKEGHDSLSDKFPEHQIGASGDESPQRSNESPKRGSHNSRSPKGSPGNRKSHDNRRSQKEHSRGNRGKGNNQSKRSPHPRRKPKHKD